MTKILIAEDDDHTRDALREVLTMEGYEVIAASDGLQAVDFFRVENPDFVCLDVMMPGLNGYEVCKQIRRQDEKVPILFLTAKTEEIDTVLGLELGADDYMTKPFALPELAARVRALIRRGQAGSGPRTSHGPLDVDRAGRRAFLSGVPLELAAREWAVLQILLEKVEKVVSKEAFIESLTNWGEDLSANAIEVYISRLRAKLEPAGIRIRTVRGFGYMLEEFREPT